MGMGDGEAIMENARRAHHTVKALDLTWIQTCDDRSSLSLGLIAVKPR